MKRVALAVLILAASCGGAQSRPEPLVQLDHTAASPAAREIAHNAPAAYAEFARAMHEAEAASGGPPSVLAARVADAQLMLEWASTQSRAAAAHARAEDAERRRHEAEEDATRMEQQAVALEHETSERIAATQSAAHAQAASGAPSSVAPADRAAAAADLLQQSELDVAAAALLGADEGARHPVDALVAAAHQAATGNDPTAALTAAGRAYVAAEGLLRAVRSGAASAAPHTDGAQLVEELSQSGGLEPRRDARGVVVVMRGLFGAGTTLAPAGRGRVEQMARVIQAHGDARVRVEAYVGGADRARVEHTALAQAQAVVAALVHAGVPQARLEPAGLQRVAGGARSVDEVDLVLVLPSEP